MPLFGRRLFHLNEDDSKDNNQQDQIYTIEHTGEQFHNSKLYEKLKAAYELERWTCECTWRSGLKHKDAYQSEIETRKSLATIVPEYFYKKIFDIIYQSIKPLEKLAEEVSIILGQNFVIGEPVQFKKRKDMKVVKGIIERIEENDDQRKRMSGRVSIQTKPQVDKQFKNVKYVLRLSDEDRTISNVQPNELQRCNFVPNREKLKTFIRSYAIRLGNRADSPWIFYDDSLKEKYELKDRLASVDIENFRKSMTITLDDIVREQERILRKQTEEQDALHGVNKKISNDDNMKNLSQNGNYDNSEITISDDEIESKSPKKKKIKSAPTTPKKSSQTNSSPVKKSRSSTKQKTPTKTKKQLTLHDMKFTKNSNSNSNSQLLQKSSSNTTYSVAVPYSLLQKLDKARRDRGVDSRVFQRLILHCARTLNDKQRFRLPDEYRTIIQNKYEELELKRRLSEMTEQEKKSYFQTKQKQKKFQQKSNEDLDLSSSKILPTPKQIDTTSSIPSHYVGDLLVICTFFTSCHPLFLSILTNDLSKSTQQFLRSFRHDHLLNAYQTSSTPIFFYYFNELLQILIRLLFKEDENRSINNAHDDNNNNDDDDKQQLNSDQNDIKINDNEHVLVDDDIELVYDVKLTDLPITSFTCQELTRLFLLRDKNEHNRIILEKLTQTDSKDFLISEQIELLLLLVNLITTDSDIMSDYFEYLTRTMTETYRERNQLIAERRKAQDEESKQKKIQLQNGENGKISSKKQNKDNSITTFKKSNVGTTNDENHETTPISANHENSNDDIGNEYDDDLKTVIQRRRQMVAMSKELKEKRELEAQKIQNDQKRELAIQRAEQTYQEALVNLQFGFRIKPLGFDRNYNRYWFFKGHAGLFVEKGWIGADINYCTQTQTLSRSSSIINGEKLIPKHETNQWLTYDNETIIQQLISSLNDRGIREQDLLANIKKIMPILQDEFQQIKSKRNPIESTDDSNEMNSQQTMDIILAFKNDLEDIETRLRVGSLGGFIINDNLIEWQTKLKQANQRNELAELLIQLQQTVADKYASGIFGIHEKKSKNAKTKKKPSTTKSSTANQHHLQIWMNDCRTCKTYSRLYVLMMIFENNIAWNKSTIGIKCKICRKKTKDEYLIVCDQCCQGYHLECLRYNSLDNIKNSINDLWYCPACCPKSTSRRRNEKQQTKTSKTEYYDADVYDMDGDSNSVLSNHDNQRDLSDVNSEQSHNDDDDDDDGDDDDNELICCVCSVETNDKNELIQCIQCRSLFHCQCHEPPLRCAPRSTTWMCSSCRNNINNEATNSNRRMQTRQRTNYRQREQKSRIQPRRQNGARRTERKNYREIDEDEFDDDEGDYDNDDETDKDSDYEQEQTSQRRSKRIRRLSPSSTSETADRSEDNYETRHARRRRVCIESSSSSSSDHDDEEQIMELIDAEKTDFEQDDDEFGDDENAELRDSSLSSS